MMTNGEIRFENKSMTVKLMLNAEKIVMKARALDAIAAIKVFKPDIVITLIECQYHK